MNKQKKTYLSIILFALSVLLIIGLKTIDVEPIGACGTYIGFAKLNSFIHEIFGVNLNFNKVTDFLGLVAILIAFTFAMTGLVQLIKRKSFFKVDREIIALGALYLVTIILYLFFEKIIINYRPIIMPDSIDPEASFPSSHTVISIVIFLSATMLLDKYIDSKITRKILKLILDTLTVFTVVGRLVSGVHWFTDIVGGLLISTALLLLFSAYKNS